MGLGDQIRKLRKKHNFSQEQLAEKIGVARQTISKWELDETAPDIKQAQMLSQIFRVSLDDLLSNSTMESGNIAGDGEKKNHVPWKKIVTISAAVACLCFVIIGIFSVVKRSKILHPQGVKGTIVIHRKDPIRIEKGNAGIIVFSVRNKPMIACRLPEGFIADAERSGFYTDEDGDYIKFNADYSDNIVNPLFGTDYYSYYKECGYDSYIEMASAAMYYDYPKLGVFSSREQIHLAGGAQLIREQLCAGQNADYYAIDGGLTENGVEMQFYGFALHFEDTTWLITLKDCYDIYYSITIKDPDGIGKTIDTVGELLSSIYNGNIIQNNNIKDTAAIQAAKNAITQYLIEYAVDYKLAEYMIYEADSRFVALHNSAAVGVFDSTEDALKAMLDDPDPSKLLATGVDNLWAYELIGQ